MKKYNLLIPMAGMGQRFIDAGFGIPKQLIMAGEKNLLDWSLSSIEMSDCNIIFVIRDEHIYNHSFDKILKSKFGDDIKIVSIKNLTKGSVCSCLEASPYIDNDMPLIINTLDVSFSPKFNPNEIKKEIDGLILTFKSNSKNYSYAQTSEEGFVIKTAEKEVISNSAAVGIYYFKKGSDFVHFAHKMIKEELTTKGEYYISPLYNLFVEAGRKIITKDVEKIYIFGTPEELDFYEKVVLKKFGEKPIAICSDHSGFDLKEDLKEILNEKNINFIDLGTSVNVDCDYSDYVSQACNYIDRGICDYGIGSCRTGQGINLSANSHPHIRSVLVYNHEVSEHAIRHNAANFFSIPSKYVSKDDLRKIIDNLSYNTFDGGRHQERIKKLGKY